MYKILSLFAAAILFCLGLGIGAPARAQGQFLAGIEDLPVMPGLQELSERTVSFDKPGGRIVHVFARGHVARDAVRQFYHEVLPQLGWRSVRGDKFEREGEVLRLTFENKRAILLVQFSIAPKAKSD